MLLTIDTQFLSTLRMNSQLFTRPCGKSSLEEALHAAISRT